MDSNKILRGCRGEPTDSASVNRPKEQIAGWKEGSMIAFEESCDYIGPERFSSRWLQDILGTTCIEFPSS